MLVMVGAASAAIAGHRSQSRLSGRVCRSRRQWLARSTVSMRSPDPGYIALRRFRSSVCRQVYLLTTTTTNRRPLFRNLKSGRIVVNTMRNLAAEELVDSLTFVVMPDHLHWLVALRNCPLPRLVQRLKGASAYRLRRTVSSGGRIWQPGYHDHAVRRQEELRRVARYIVLNPVRAGLVTRAGDYPLWDSIWVDGDWPVRG